MIHFKMRDPVFKMRYKDTDISNAYWQECKGDVCPQSKVKQSSRGNSGTIINQHY